MKKIAVVVLTTKDSSVVCNDEKDLRQWEKFYNKKKIPFTLSFEIKNEADTLDEMQYTNYMDWWDSLTEEKKNALITEYVKPATFTPPIEMMKEEIEEMYFTHKQ